MRLTRRLAGLVDAVAGFLAWSLRVSLRRRTVMRRARYRTGAGVRGARGVSSKNVQM